jgi:hypothetical protein
MKAKGELTGFMYIKGGSTQSSTDDATINEFDLLAGLERATYSLPG